MKGQENRDARAGGVRKPKEPKADQRHSRDLNVRLRAAERAVVEISEREQRRLGQDLHDGLSQSIAGVKLMAERVRQGLQAAQLSQSKDLEVIERRLAEALLHVDTISRGLYPIELETNGLTAALADLARRLSATEPVDCRFSAPQPISLGGVRANHLYRIAQEAVSNAIKGGRATQIRIQLSAKGHRASLIVADNGIGFHRGPRRQGMGLHLMESRSRLIDATLSFRARPRGGTVVSCAFSLGASTTGQQRADRKLRR